MGHDSLMHNKVSILEIPLTEHRESIFKAEPLQLHTCFGHSNVVFAL